MNQFKIFSIFLVSLTLMAGCAKRSKDVDEAEGTATPIVKVSAIEMKDDINGGKLHIQADREPKYNVFKLSDPDKIVVDIMDAKLGSDVPTSLPGNDSIQEIKVQGLEDSLSSVVRLEIFLKGPAANYVAGLDGTNLVVSILKPGSPGEAPKSSEGEKVLLPPTPSSGEPMAAVPLPIPSAESSSPSEKPLDPGQSVAQAPSLEAPPLPPPPPLPTVPETPAEIAPESSTKMGLSKADSVPNTGTSVGTPSTPEAPPAEVPPVTDPNMIAPMPMPLPNSTADSDKSAVTAETNPDKVVTEEEVPLGTKGSSKSKSKKRLTKGDNIKRVESQEIPNSGFTEGTSLLTELDTKVYTGKRVSLEFQDADVQDILRLIADVSKLNIVTGDDVKGNLSLKLIDVPWDQALDIILTTLSLDKVQHGNILRVAPVEKLKKEREIALANDRAAKQLEPLRLKLINVNYATADEMSARIKNMLSDRGTVDTDVRTNTLIVKDIREHLSRIENLVKALDTQTPQVRIESRIVQANDTFTKALGIQWGPTMQMDDVNGKARHWQFPRTINVGTSPGFSQPAPKTLTQFAVDALPGGTTGGELGFRLGSIFNIFDLDLHLSYAENEQLARIVSRPSISVLDNKTAHIIQGTKIPFLSTGQNGSNVQFQDAGIEITVTPQITSDGSVIMKLSTKSNEPGSQTVGGNTTILLREATSEMLVKSGRTAVLGGVFKTSDIRGKGGVPGLMHLPVIGWLFKGENATQIREETLIFITPYILSDLRAASTTPIGAGDLEP